MNEKYVEKKLKNVPGVPEVSISNDDGSFYTLSNGSKVNKKIFENYYEKVESISVDNFFQSSVSSSKMVQDLMNLDTSRVPDVDSGAQMRVHENFDHTKTAGQNPVLNQQNQNQYAPPTIPDRMSQNDVSQYRVLDDDEEDAAVDSFIRGQQPPVTQTNQTYVPPQQQQQYTEQPQIQQPPMQQINPEEMLFKMFKNNFDVNINLSFDRKMASPDFIKMMSENFETDIVRYYTKKFLSSIVNDPTMLEDVIYKQLYTTVFGEEEVKVKKEKKATPLKEGKVKSQTKEVKNTPPPVDPPAPTPKKPYKSKINELKK